MKLNSDYKIYEYVCEKCMQKIPILFIWNTNATIYLGLHCKKCETHNFLKIHGDYDFIIPNKTFSKGEES